MFILGRKEPTFFVCFFFILKKAKMSMFDISAIEFMTCNKIACTQLQVAIYCSDAKLQSIYELRCSTERYFCDKALYTCGVNGIRETCVFFGNNLHLRTAAIFSTSTTRGTVVALFCNIYKFKATSAKRTSGIEVETVRKRNAKFRNIDVERDCVVI